MSKVLYEFSLRYPHVKENAFRCTWDKLSAQVFDFYKSQYGVDFECPWSEDIAIILALLKMLPTKAVGGKMSAIESSYKKAEQKLVVFRKVIQECDLILMDTRMHYIASFYELIFKRYNVNYFVHIYRQTVH